MTTWTGASALVTAYGSRSATPTAWGTVTRSLVDANGGADYQLVLREVYPLTLTDDRPLTITESLPEGRA